MSYYAEVISCDNCYYSDNQDMCSKCIKHTKWAHFRGKLYIEGMIKRSEEEKT